MYQPNFQDAGKTEHHPIHEFASVAGATMAGAYIGHKFDKSRAGRWVNNNPTIDRLWVIMIFLIKLGIVGLVLYYLFLVAILF